ncbi:AEC family transporter [Candidatus Saccharibacteria bacterium]|nr:AEC family transporter [Candidatus Saccharibacteria bacterium]
MQIELTTFYSRLGSIALIMVLGFILGKLKLIDKHTNNHLVNLLLSVFMPASLFMAFPSTYSQATTNLFFSGLLAGVIVMTALIIISKIVFNKFWFKDQLRYEAQFGLVFNNATFLGYPIVASTFGEQGIIAYCGFIVIFNIALFSYGIYLFKHKFSWRMLLDTIINPNIVAVIIGMTLFLINFKLPAVLDNTISFVGNATTPLSILCIGFMLSEAHLKHLIKKWRLIIPAAVQLIIGPVATFFLLKSLGFPLAVISVCTLIEALPTATSLGLFATKYGGDEVEASELVTISTILSIGSLPLMLTLLLAQ